MSEEPLFSRLTGIETTLSFIRDDIKQLHSENSTRRGEINVVATALREESKTTIGGITEKITENKEQIEKLKNSFGLIKWTVAIVAGVAITTLTTKIIALLNMPIHSESSQVRTK